MANCQKGNEHTVTLFRVARGLHGTKIPWKNSSLLEAACVENANLGKMLPILTLFIVVNTYHYAVLARNLVKLGGVGGEFQE